MRQLSDIEEIIDRSIEKAIYDVAVANGYTPDRFINNTLTLYNTAIQNIITTKGFAIEIYGHGAPQDKGEIGVPRIVIKNAGFMEGFLGSDPNGYYESDGGGKFNRVNSMPKTSELKHEITLVSNKAEHDRILHSILAAALPNRSYVKFYNDSSQEFLFLYLASRYANDTREGIIYKTYIYRSCDLFEAGDEIIRSNIAPISQIDIVDENNDNFLNIQ